jgi:hypothetical protein
MNGVIFEEARVVDEAAPNRADIACFIGFVNRRAGALPESLADWLVDNGWRTRSEVTEADDPLLNTPVPLENFEAFDQLFAWDIRPGAGWTTWLGAAIKSFFSQGGSRCFVIRVGDAWDYDQPLTSEKRSGYLELLVPKKQSAPADKEHWSGIEVLRALDEAAFVCLPDLSELTADATLGSAALPPLPAGPEEFTECSTTVAPKPDKSQSPSASPASDTTGYANWFGVVHAAAAFLYRERKDVQLILSVPLPADGSTPQGDLLRTLTSDSEQDPENPAPVGLALDMKDSLDGIATAFVQLVYPWLGTSTSDLLPGGLEPPDGAFAGVAARTVATRGVHRSLGRQPLRLVSRFFPPTTARDQQIRPSNDPGLIQRVSLLGDTPDGPSVLSDVTTSQAVEYRPASVNRLTAAIIRTAQQLGREVVFDLSGPELWRKIERRLDNLLNQFFQAGALLGESTDEAFSVRCDETTMTLNDIDSGRVIAVVQFAPAQPVGMITVVLALRDGVPEAAQVGD